jgi:DNA-binding response OmpR family regulator
MQNSGAILFVEDHPDTRAMMSYMLEEAGFQITIAETLAQATHFAETQEFDLYLLNHVFPDGSGLTLCRLLRERFPDRPIVFFSAAAHPREQEEGIAAGANAYLTKPQDILNVTETVVRLVNAANACKAS